MLPLATPPVAPTGLAEIRRRRLAPEKARQGWHICSSVVSHTNKLRQERHRLITRWEDVAPTELGIFCGPVFYKYVAPLALAGG